MAHNMAIVKSRVIERAKRLDVDAAGTDTYADLMQQIEGEVQTTLEEEGMIEF